MSATTNQIKVIAVIKASKSGATVVINGQWQVIDWPTLRAAAKQDDAELRATYAQILAEALRLASIEKTLEVRISNRTNTPHGNCAELYDVAGEFVSGRIVAADFGLSGTYAAALRDAESAKSKLTANGYTVAISK